MKDVLTSPKIISLDDFIKAERNMIRKAELKAERAGYLARHGSLELSQKQFDEVQREFLSQTNLRITVWLLIVKAWIAHSNESLAVARDSMRRAYALSTASSELDLRSISVAWLAQAAYSNDQFNEMIEFMRIGMELSDVAPHCAKARLYMAIGQAYHFCDRIDLAHDWYCRSRAHALAEHDEPNLSALNFNIAARRSTYLLRSSIFGLPQDADALLANIGLDTSLHYDQLLGVEALPYWVPLVKATVLSANDKFSEALSLYRSYLADGTKKGKMLQHRGSFLSDLAWCQFNVGDLDGAALSASEAESCIAEMSYVEDLVTACGRLGQYFGCVGNDALAASYMRRAQQNKEDLAALQTEVLTLLDKADLN